MQSVDYKQKYLKYKNKYLELKGGNLQCKKQKEAFDALSKKHQEIDIKEKKQETIENEKKNAMLHIKNI